MPPKSGAASHGRWISYVLCRSKLRLERSQALVETQLDGRLTIKWVTWICTVDKWPKIGAEAKDRSVPFGLKMIRLTEENRNSDEPIIRPSHASHRRLAWTRAWLLRLNIYSWEVLYRFKSARSYSKLGKGICEATDWAQIKRLKSLGLDLGYRKASKT